MADAKPKDPNARPLGRVFLEALAWGAGFVIAGGALKLGWNAITKKTNNSDDDGEADDEDGDD